MASDPRVPECSGYLERLALAAVASEEDRAEFDDAVALFSDAVSAVGAESAFERDLPAGAQMALRAEAAAWRALSDC